MWKRAAAKLLSLRSVARPNHMGTSSLWSAIFRPSGTVTKKDEDVIAIATGHEHVEPKFEISGNDLVDHEFKNGPFGTKEKPAVMRSYYHTQMCGCSGRNVFPHEHVDFWLIDGKVHVCPVCGQHFLLKCIGIGGVADPYPVIYR